MNILITRRVRAGVFALMLALTQLILPVQTTFATGNSNGNGGNENCPAGTTLLAKFNRSGNAYQLEEGGNVTVSGTTTSGTFTVLNGHTVSAVVVKGGTDNKTDSYNPAVTSGSFNNSTLSTGGPNPQVPGISNLKFCESTTPRVTIPVLETVDPCGLNNVAWKAVLPADTAEIDWSENGTTRTATLKGNRTWTDLTTAAKVFSLPADSGTLCEQPKPMVTIPTLETVDPCGLNNVSWKATLPTDTDEIDWSENGTTRTATLKGNRTWTDLTTAAKVFSLPADKGELCPATVAPCVESKGTFKVTDKSQFADYRDESRSQGRHEFTKDGVRIYTVDNSSQAKVAWYKSVNFGFGDLGEPEMNYTSTEGIEPGLQIVVDFDGDGTEDGILVGESVYGDDWWLTNTSAQFVKDGAPNNGGGSGSQWYGTLSEWYTSFKDAEVKAVGFSLGSGVKADGVLKSLTFGCYTWVFKKEKVDNFTPEIYKRDQFGSIVTDARFSVEVCQKVKKQVIELRTTLGKNEVCKTYTNVDFGTDGQWFKNTVDYKKNKETRVTITETYTPPACRNQGNWVFTWSRDKKSGEVSILTDDEDNKGNWSNGSNVWILRNECIQGMGSVGADTPTVPVTQSGSGSAGELPAELPMTGNGSVFATWFALLAAILTYGAVFFLQPKKQGTE